MIKISYNVINLSRPSLYNIILPYLYNRLEEDVKIQLKDCLELVKKGVCIPPFYLK